MSEVLSIYEIADLNKNSITAKDNFSFIHYLDTSSLTKNKVDSLQFLESEFPSRAKRKVKINTILYSTVRPNQEHFGIIENQIEDNLIASTGFTTIDIVSSKINAKYLYYKLIQPFVTNYLQGIAENSVSAYPSIKPEAIGNLRFSFPNLLTQQIIASVLSTIDDKIELNNQINDNLEQMAKTLYDYWFVQFDFPNENGKPYKSSGGRMIWNEVLKREIPKGWEVNSLGSFIARDKSGDWGKEQIEGNYITKVECIRGADINGIFRGGELKTSVRFILKKNESKILLPYDLVIEISGGSPTQSTGRLAYITNEVIDRFENPLICSNFCKAVSLNELESFFYFIYSWNNAYNNSIFFGFEGKTSGIKNLLFESLVSTYKIVKPSKLILENFQNNVSLFESKRQINLKQNQQLSSLRDWLLPMLMSGQVKVK